MSRLTLCALVALAACERERPHVFQSPPPAQPAVPHAPATVAAPEAPFGSLGAGASIASVRATTTGAPIAISDVGESFQVTTMVARGPGEWDPGHDARIELVFTGAHRVIFSHPVERPAPAIIAHVFTVPLRRDSPDGLLPGHYRMQVRLVMRDTFAIAVSLPLVMRVR